jgi:uncharacterized protein with NRDE domain
MCLIVFGIDIHPDYNLILAANRDEFYARPTAAAHVWPENPGLVAGKDLQAGGTWMGVHENGRFASVTNYRDLSNIRADARSRGELPIAFLNGDLDAEGFLQHLHNDAKEYNGFNLLLWDTNTMWHYSNYEGKINKLKSGLYGLSNALLDTPWPKVVNIKREFEKKINSPFDHAALISILQKPGLADDDDLPSTGVPKEWEKALSAICIRTEGYGTCCSSVLTIDRHNKMVFTEHTYAVGDREEQEVTFKIP